MPSQSSVLPARGHTIPQRMKPTAGRLFKELLVPAIGIILSLGIVKAALPLPSLCGVGLFAAVAASTIVVRALLRSQLAAYEQLLFGAHSAMIALFLTFVPAELQVISLGYESLFAPVVAMQEKLYVTWVTALELTLYYWVIYMTWDRLYRTLPQPVWSTILSASVLITGVMVLSAHVPSNIRTLLLPVGFVALFGPPVFWILRLSGGGARLAKFFIADSDSP